MRLSFRTVSATLLLLGVAVGCATYQVKVQSAREALRGDPAAAAEYFKPLAEKEGRDQLVYLMDYATALQLAGNYEESNRIFAQADSMSEIKDYHSLTNVAASTIVSEEMVQYKGDHYEKLLINAFKAINYTMLGDMEAALIEVRKLNNKLDRYRNDGKKNYEQNAFVVYLSAMLWEANSAWDDAYIAYQKAYQLNPELKYLREDLVRSAFRAQRPEEFKKWSGEFGIKLNPAWRDKNRGEIVVIHQQGWGPRKQPRKDAPRFPELVPVFSNTTTSRVDIEDYEPEESQEVYSVEKVAIKVMNDDYAALVARRAVGVVAKAVVADQVRQKNALLGDILEIGLNLSDRADLRQWSTLPRTFRIARFTLPFGKYKITLRGANTFGNDTNDFKGPLEVVVKARKKTFINWRTLN